MFLACRGGGGCSRFTRPSSPPSFTDTTKTQFSHPLLAYYILPSSRRTSGLLTATNLLAVALFLSLIGGHPQPAPQRRPFIFLPTLTCLRLRRRIVNGDVLCTTTTTHATTHNSHFHMFCPLSIHFTHARCTGCARLYNDKAAVESKMVTMVSSLQTQAGDRRRIPVRSFLRSFLRSFVHSFLHSFLRSRRELRSA